MNARIEPKYLRTGKMAEYVGRSVRWLKAQKDAVFKKGIHYHQPAGEREPFWDVDAIEQWIRSQSQSNEVDEILNKML